MSLNEEEMKQVIGDEGGPRESKSLGVKDWQMDIAFISLVGLVFLVMSLMQAYSYPPKLL